MSPMRQRPFRPGFDHTVAASPQKVREAFELALSESRLEGEMLSRSGLFRLPGQAADAFAPWLHLEVHVHRDESEEEPRRAYVRGFFTPHPSLWTGFVLAAIALATVVFFAGCWGIVQLQLGKPGWALWVALGALAGLAALWVLSNIGQARARTRMEELHEFARVLMGELGELSPGGGERKPAESAR